jgi:hypothetical protein
MTDRPAPRFSGVRSSFKADFEVVTAVSSMVFCKARKCVESALQYADESKMQKVRSYSEIIAENPKGPFDVSA